MTKRTASPEQVLTLRQLNRATLARQMLLQREDKMVPEAVEQLVGLQAQAVNASYIGLWTRLKHFQRQSLTFSIEQRQVVRATMMRSTLHLVTASDYLFLRPLLQPALTRALHAFFSKEAKGVDIERIVRLARPYIEEKPRTFVEIRAYLSEQLPELSPELLAYVVRTHLPLVQIPPGGIWGMGGSPAHALAEIWLGQALQTASEIRTMVLRYLTAFGPATTRDIQTWSGLTGLQSVMKTLLPELRIFQDEQGNQLFDLPDGPLPSEDIVAPPRYLPEFDNLLLSHANRTRIIADEYRRFVFLSAGRVRATFLVDGFVQGTWKIEKEKQIARLVIEPFLPLAENVREALIEEGKKLLSFVEDTAEKHEIMLQ